MMTNYKSTKKSKILLNQDVTFNRRASLGISSLKLKPGKKTLNSKRPSPLYMVIFSALLLSLGFLLLTSNVAKSSKHDALGTEPVSVELANINKLLKEELAAEKLTDQRVDQSSDNSGVALDGGPLSENAVVTVARDVELEPITGGNTTVKDTRDVADGENSYSTAGIKGVSLSLVNTLKVGRNDSFYSIMYSLGLETSKINSIINGAKDYYDFSKLKENDRFNIRKVGGEVVSVDYKISDLESLMVDLSGDGVPHVSHQKVPYVVENYLGYGEIKTSFYEAAIEAGLNATTIMNLTDIFAWDIDFATEVQAGDKFSVLVEAYYVDGLRVGTGKILAASFSNKGSQFEAIYYKDKSGKGAYYDVEGNTIRRALLKSPLRYSRISSSFSRKRFHPILKKYKAHHGVDYAAPRGTAVEASGDGVVVSSGWNGGYGKYIKIRHNGVYSTAYGHLSKIKKGIKKGTRIKQGTVIGYVGSTGRSTGPHLHYEVHLRGKMVNPLSIKNSPRSKVIKDEIADYKGYAERMKVVLNSDDTKVATTEFPSYWVF